MVPPIDQPSKNWHTSPFIDLAAYQLSWIWILIPLVLLEPEHPRAYFLLFAFVLSVAQMHRHYTMPYVYLDRQVFSQHVTRFSLFMFLLMLGFLASGLGWNWVAQPGFFRPVDLALVVVGSTLVAQAVVADRREHRFRVPQLVTIAAPFVVLVGAGVLGAFDGDDHVRATAAGTIALALVSLVVALDVRRSTSERARRVAFVFPAIAAIVAGLGVASVAAANRPLNGNSISGAALVGVVGSFAVLWNIWHTLMQKFGILRMYAAKSGIPVNDRTPAWSDRLLVFGSLPFIALSIAPAQRDVVAHANASVVALLLPLVDGLIAARPYVLPLAGLLAAASIALFGYYESRADRPSWPRRAMGLSLVALNVCFFLTSPLKVYVAYGFSHAVEYCVFVWAFLRRRYAKPQPKPPLMQRALRHPWLAYGAFSLFIGGMTFAIDPGRHLNINLGRVHVRDVSIATWLFAFAIWHSIAHFYYDGFLWKMRAPEVRANL